MGATKIAAIGDSLTYGYPYPPEYSWVRAAGEHLGVSIVNKGVCGETTGDMRQRFGVDVAALAPDYAIITGGANDAFLGMAAAEVAGNVAAIAAAAHTRGIKPLIGLPPPVNYPEETLLAEYRRLLRLFASANALPVLDFHAALVDTSSGGLKYGLHTDGVHPNEDGYALMAAAAVAVLGKILPSSSNNPAYPV